MKIQSASERVRLESLAEANMAENRMVIAEYQALAGMSESVQAAYAKSYARGRDVGIKAERERVRGILTCSEANGRAKLARNLAFDSDIDIEAAKKHLSLTAKDAGDNQFAVAMARLANPKVGVGGDEPLDGTGISTTADVYARRARNMELARANSSNAAAPAGH